MVSVKELVRNHPFPASHAPTQNSVAAWYKQGMSRELTVGQGPAQAAAGIALNAEEDILFVSLHEKGG